MMSGIIVLLAAIGANMGLEHLNLTDMKGMLVVAAVFATVMISLMTPIYIIFGGENARMAILAVYGIIAVIALAGDVEAAAAELFANLASLKDWQLACLGGGIMLALVLVSMVISMVGLEKKEY